MHFSATNLIDRIRTFGTQDCALCGSLISARAQVCAPCAAALPRQGAQVCPQCAIGSRNGAVCGACLADPPNFDDSVSAYAYRFPLDQLLQRFKYAAHLSLAGLFAEHLARRITARVSREAMPTLVLCMPLSRQRLAQRGFNQAAVIAEGVARKLDIAYDRRALQRVRDTAPQAGLKWAERQANIRGAFAACELAAQHVALVDDVMTTGATMSEAARTLKRAGAKRVSAWVLARAEAEESMLTLDRSVGDPYA